MAFVTINPAVLPGGYDMRSDLIGGIHTPASKIQIGALGVDGGFVHAGNPLPVALVAGTISGVATEATLAAVEAVLDAIYARMASGAQHVQVDNFPAATGLTDAQLRVSPVSISAAALPLPAGAATSARQDAEIAGLASIFGILGDGTQHVRVDNFPSSSGGLTDAELRASPVPVSGPLTDAQLRASAVPLSATSLPLPAGASTAARQDTGNASLASIDGKAPALVAGRVPVDGSGATQPISAAALPLPSGAATSANQTSGAQKAIARSGAKGASAAADVTSTDVDANTQALDVVVKNSIPISGTIVADQGAAGVDSWLVDATGSVVAIGASALPSGAATSANQATEIAALNSIDAKLANPMPVSGPLTDAQLRASAVPVDGSGATQPISAAALPLPAGASTAARQDAGNASLASIDGKLTSPVAVTGALTDAQLRASAVPVSDGGASLTVDSLQLPASLVGGRLSVDGSGVTQPVSAAALPLPAGASTSALQATGNASLASIDGKLANPLPVSGTVTITDGGGSITVDSLQLPAALVSGRLSVDGSGTTQPISASALPLPAGAATEATLATRAGEHVAAASPHACRLSDGAAFYQAALTGQFPAALAGGRLDVNVGASALPSGAAQEHVGAASFHSVRLTDGAAFYAAPAAAQLPAALVGGRLDANVGAWLGATTPTVGQKTMAASLPVAIASDQGIVPTKETRSATCATTTVAASASSVTLLAANANRLGASIYNDSASAYLYVKCGTTASATSFEFLLAPGGALGPGGYAEIPFGYTGRIDGIWTAAVGNARIGEFT